MAENPKDKKPVFSKDSAYFSFYRNPHESIVPEPKPLRRGYGAITLLSEESKTAKGSTGIQWDIINDDGFECTPLLNESGSLNQGKTSNQKKRKAGKSNHEVKIPLTHKIQKSLGLRKENKSIKFDHASDVDILPNDLYSASSELA